MRNDAPKIAPKVMVATPFIRPDRPLFDLVLVTMRSVMNGK